MKNLLLLALTIIPTIFYGMENDTLKHYVVYNIEYIKETDSFSAIGQLPGQYEAVTQVIKKNGSNEIVYKKTSRMGENIPLDEKAIEAVVKRLTLHEKKLEVRTVERVIKQRRI